MSTKRILSKSDFHRLIRRKHYLERSVHERNHAIKNLEIDDLRDQLGIEFEADNLIMDDLDLVNYVLVRQRLISKNKFAVNQMKLEIRAISQLELIRRYLA